MNQLRRVKIDQCSQDLTADETHMTLLENSLSHQRIEVRLNQLKDQIQIFVVLTAHGLVQLDDVRVVKLGQDHQLSIGSLSIS